MNKFFLTLALAASAYSIGMTAPITTQMLTANAASSDYSKSVKGKITFSNRTGAILKILVRYDPGPTNWKIFYIAPGDDLTIPIATPTGHFRHIAQNIETGYIYPWYDDFAGHNEHIGYTYDDV